MTELEQIAPSGPKVSPWIAGFWRLQHWNMSPQQLHTFILQLLELGISSVDHAMVYRSEEPFGRALALQPSLREHLQIITKCGIRPSGFGKLGATATNHFDSSATAIIESVEASLAALGTDYIDILLLHRPDYLMAADEVAEAFARLQCAGKVRAFGVSNFSVQQFELLRSRWPELVTNQVEFSALALEQLESGVFEQCQRYGLRPMLWSCLGGGRLLQPVDERGHRILAALRSVAAQLEHATEEQVAFAWVAALPCRPLPILGSSQIERIRLALHASQLRLEREQWYAIWEAANGAPVP